MRRRRLAEFALAGTEPEPDAHADANSYAESVNSHNHNNGKRSITAGRDDLGRWTRNVCEQRLETPHDEF